jgi:hypothetical protein
VLRNHSPTENIEFIATFFLNSKAITVVMQEKIEDTGWYSEYYYEKILNVRY